VNPWVPVLLTGGAGLIGISVLGLRPTRQHAARIPCGVPSPDLNSCCTKSAGHDGWCHDGQVEWRGDVWNMDEYADTQARATQSEQAVGTAVLDPPTVLVPRVVSIERKKWPRSRWVAAGVALLGLLVAQAQDAPRSEAACAQEWVQATPARPLCSNSPDRELSGPDLVAKYCVGVNDRRVCNDKTMGVPLIRNDQSDD
jgi:hypothetical protein